MGCCSSLSNCSLHSVAMTKTVSQFAEEVVHFSSQYGTDGNVSYVVPNLAGPSTIYPNYEDVTAACVFRTYGSWWQQAPSAPCPIGRFHKKTFLGQDFVDLLYAEKVYPTEVRIYETYHPGAVVQIFACELYMNQNGQMVNHDVRWQLLWSGEPQLSSDARIFSPPLKKVKFAANLIRLVFHHLHLNYYTELDAVELVGTVSEHDDGTDLDAVYASHLQALSISPQDGTDVEVLSAGITTDNGYFDLLPGELIQLIFGDLELPDLCRVAATCKLFKKHCYDQLLFLELDLQPRWHMVNVRTLEGLKGRCEHLQKLSLSWCGDWEAITPEPFSRFISDCGANLLCLRLAACVFLTAKNINVIASTCQQLQELDLSSVRILDSDAFDPLATLTNLTRLNLYRTRISEQVTIKIIRNSPKLEYINLDAVQTIQNYDNVAAELAKCRNLLSVNLWRARTLTLTGLSILAKGCKDMLEIDLGWCVWLRSDGSNYHIENFVQSCKKLRKLYLTALRSVSDSDLYAIAANLPDLEQLDILGTLAVGPMSVQRVLESCPKLRLFDLSFCNGVPEDAVRVWRETYPNVSIKRSFVSS
ncbi:F-box/LRR-repeat protein 4-like [Asterias amurensis]|uniref:F-box/LRR-repeat protein 4-like n=1 Tax=Asterias amurensis TaxID=7602 RepID=UPI003AB7C3EC